MAVQISGNDITVPRDGSFTRNVTIGGTLTYEDVTNIDSVGLVTARNGIEIGARPGVAASISVDGNMIVSGISTFGGAANFAAISGTTGTFTGDVSIADAIVHTGDNSKIRFPSNDTITFETSGNEGVRIDAGGRFLVGTNAARTFGGGEYAHLQVEGTTQSGSQITVTRNTNDTYAPNISLVKTRGTSDGAVTTVQDNDSLGTIQFRGADGSDVFAVAASITGEVDGSPSDGTDMPGALVFGTTADGAASPTERLRITSAGDVGINRTSPAANLDIASTSEVAVAIDGWSAIGGGGSSNLKIGGLTGSQYTRLDFYTGGSERLRIQSTGVVNIGDTTASALGDRLLQIGKTDRSATFIELRTSTSGTSGIVMSDGTSNDSSGYRGTIEYFHNSDYMVFKAAASERLRIGSDGKIYIGTTSGSGEFLNIVAPQTSSSFSVELYSGYGSGISGSFAAKINCHGFYTNSYGHGGVIFRNNDDTSHNRAARAALFQNNDGTTVGTINFGTSSTSYNTSSDYRLKENQVTISDGITRLKTLKPYRFNFKDVPSETIDGFFAHEVTAVPNAVEGTKDGVDVNGDPEYQTIDHSKLVPLLTAALQEAVTEIESLKSRLDTAGL